MCGRAGAHTGARDGAQTAPTGAGCSTSEQSASRASAPDAYGPARHGHTARTGPTHTAPARARAPGRRQRGTPAPAHVAQCAMRNTHTRPRRTHGARASARRSKIKGTRGAGRRTRGKRGPRTRTLTICARVRDQADMTRVRARHTARTAHTAHGRTAHGTDAPAGSWRVARRSGVQNLNSRPHAHAGRNGVAHAHPYDMRASTRENRPRARAPLRYARTRASLTICAGAGRPPGWWAPPPPPAPVSRHLSGLTGRGRRVGGGCSESEHRPTRRDRRAPGVDTDANPLGVSP